MRPLPLLSVVTAPDEIARLRAANRCGWVYPPGPQGCRVRVDGFSWPQPIPALVQVLEPDRARTPLWVSVRRGNMIIFAKRKGVTDKESIRSGFQYLV
jgi:hypothetical protein